MKASEVMDVLFGFGADGDYSNTCDTLKAGNPNVEVTKAAVTMFPTVEVIKKAHEWGAQLLVVHEPTYYKHMDEHANEKIECLKRELLESTGMAVYRFHDHPHYNVPDIITTGVLNALKPEGEIVHTDLFDTTRIILSTPTSPVDFARLIEERLGIRHVRICGTRDALCTNVSVMVGSPGGIMEELCREETEILLIGEGCEWAQGEYARDAAALGYKKALLFLGHAGSERAGMEYTAELLQEKCPQLDVRYFEGGEVYTYTDSE